MGGAFYLVGGRSYSSTDGRTIGRFGMATQKWTHAGDLIIGRHGHNVIYDGKYLLVVGGVSSGGAKSERCKIENGEVTCSSQEPSLQNYSTYPELLLVPSDFCYEMP